MAVPWGVLVSTLPVLIESAGKLFNRAERPVPVPESNGSLGGQIAALTRRLENLEGMEADQAGLLKQTIEQLQALALKAAATETRANIALALAAIAAVVALAALVLR